MMRINTTAIATTSRRWMKPPNVYEVTTPSSQRIISRKKIVQSMEHLQMLSLRAPGRFPNQFDFLSCASEQVTSRFPPSVRLRVRLLIRHLSSPAYLKRLRLLKQRLSPAERTRKSTELAKMRRSEAFAH